MNLRIAAILGYAAIYVNGTLYWFCHTRDHQATELACELSELLKAPMVVVAYMPPVEQHALAQWAIRQIEQAREGVGLEQWWALEDCRVNLWEMQRRSYGAANAA